MKTMFKYRLVFFILCCFSLFTSFNSNGQTSIITSGASAIMGPDNVCTGSTTILTDASGGGTWSSSNTLVAAIGTTGIVMGISAGTAIISYISTSGNSAITLTVNPTPSAIGGITTVCAGATSTLTDGTFGGSWSVGGTSGIATISLFSGVLSGEAVGTATISYTLSTGCAATTTITVDPFGTPVSGSSSVCPGNSMSLTDPTAGGIWSSGNTALATVGTNGLVTGLSGGVVNISYALLSGCIVIKAINVVEAYPISGNTNVCVGSVNMLTDATTGGTWSGGSPLVGTINSVTGAVTGIASGNMLITYTLSEGCITATVVNVYPIPPNFDVTGGGSYCGTGSGLDIGLSSSDTGISYSLYKSTTLVNTLAGTGSPLDFGVFSPPGTYTVLATDIFTGCTSAMTGNAVITVVTPSVPVVGISLPGGTTVCAGQNLTFTALPVNGGLSPVYKWYVNNTIVASGSVYNYIPSNGDVVSVTLISDMACTVPDSATHADTISVVTNVIPSVTLTVSPGDSLCPGTPVTITAAPVNGGISPGYTWIKNGIAEGSGFSSSYTFMPLDGDNVYCNMSSSITCALPVTVHSNNINMIVPPIYIPIVSVSAFPGLEIAVGERDTFVASVAFAGLSYSYQWLINSIPVPGATTDTFISNTLSNHDIVTCDVTGISLCGTATRSASVVIVDMLIPPTGVRQVESNTNIALVPNPNNGQFILLGTLQQSNNEKLTMIITDMLGRVVYRQSITTANGKINEHIELGNTIIPGMYIMELTSGDADKVIHFAVAK